MMITKKALPRRTFLRGVGATVALPLLDAMVPSLTAIANTPARPVRRLGFVYVPMGSNIAQWTPPGGSGPLKTLSTSLGPLARVKDQLTVVSNLELKNSYPGTHATSNAGFLSAAKAKWTESTDYHLGTTVDQIAAQQIGQETQLPSLELAMDLLDMVGQCDNGYACVYQNNISWSSPTSPLPAEAHPRVVFERLFALVCWIGCVTTVRGCRASLALRSGPRSQSIWIPSGRLSVVFRRLRRKRKIIRSLISIARLGYPQPTQITRSSCLTFRCWHCGRM